MLNEILKYQNLDARLIKIERDLENSQQKREVNKFVDQVKKAQEKLVELERTASVLVADFEKVKQTFEEESSKVENAKKVDYKSQSEVKLRESEANIKREIGQLLNLNKTIKTLSNKISATVQEFEKTKAYGIECKNKYKASLNQYNKYSEGMTAEKNKILNELAELSKKIDPKIMAKYNKMRFDNKFPILVPLTNQSCGGCAMGLPNARYDILKKYKFLECENCHRIIYLDEE